MSIANNLTTIAENVPKVYDAGKAKGWDEFWDTFQNYGNRTVYQRAFSDGQGWTRETFRPKYPMIVESNADRMFYGLSALYSFEEQGVVLDTSKLISFTFGIANCSNLKKIPVLNLTSLYDGEGYFSRAFYSKSLETIEKIILKDTGTQNFKETFYNCPNLANITFEGAIGRNLSFQWSPLLTAESMKSIISCLVNYKDTTDEGKYKITFLDECWARLEADSTSPTGGTWQDYVNQELGWLT